ncbi:MAG: ribonuclease P protein component [Xanthobacteraceae bacterium]|nr:MAG: ribonuclease P protein component [Xanthobacteraceae bacterium]
MERIRHRADFLAAAAAARVGMAAFVVQERRRDDAGPPRVGFTVTRKVGNAVERNRIRRRLRELVRRIGPDVMRPHSDYVMIGRRAALERDFAVMLDDLRAALARLDRPGRNRTRPFAPDAPSSDPPPSIPPRGDVS